VVETARQLKTRLVSSGSACVPDILVEFRDVFKHINNNPNHIKDWFKWFMFNSNLIIIMIIITFIQ